MQTAARPFDACAVQIPQQSSGIQRLESRPVRWPYRVLKILTDLSYKALKVLIKS